MAWGQKFTSDLTIGTEAPTFIARAIAMPEAPGPVWEIRGPANPSLLQAGLIDEVNIGGSRVSTDSWSATTGTITLTLKGDVAGLLPRMHRGQLVEVLAGFSGYSDDDYQTIGLGQVFDFQRTGDGAVYELVLRDIWAALSSRISTSADELSLFAGLPSATTVLNAYTAGDATIDVTSSVEFPKETGEDGAFSVVDGAGETFYITWSSSAGLGPGRAYTIVTAGALGTVDANAGAGNAVTAIAYVKDEPVDIIRKILASTGAGTNGDYDTLPKTWGYGIPDRFLDHDDIDDTRSFTRTANTDRDWEAWSTAAQSDGLSWLFSQVFQTGGWFPAIRQGGMTVRAAVHPFDTDVNLQADTVRSDSPFIHDGLLAGGRRGPLRGYSAWSPDHPVEYYRVTVTAGVSSDSRTEAVGALPSEDTKSIDVTPWVHNNKAQHLATIGQRLSVWAQRLPERFSIRMPNLTLAVHAVGGVPILNSGILFGRLSQTSQGFDNVAVIITQMSVRWSTRTMEMSFEVVSDSASDF